MWQVSAYRADGQFLMAARCDTREDAERCAERWMSKSGIDRVSVTRLEMTVA